MALIQDKDKEGDIGEPLLWRDSFFEDSREGIPWENRVRFNKPQKTWSGKVVYFRKLHPFTETDLVRIMDRITPKPTMLEKAIKVMESFFRYAGPLKEMILAGLDGKSSKMMRVFFEALLESFSEVMQLTNFEDIFGEMVALINTANDSLPVEEAFELIKKTDYEAITADYEGQIKDLEVQISDLREQIEAMEVSRWQRR